MIEDLQDETNLALPFRMILSSPMVEQQENNKKSKFDDSDDEFLSADDDESKLFKYNSGVIQKSLLNMIEKQ